MKIESIELDPARLTGLARKARDAKAVVQGVNARIAELRDRKADLQRRSQLAEVNSQAGGPRDRAAYIEQAEALAADASAVVAQLADADAEASELASIAAVHSGVFNKALRLAVDRNLSIPLDLAAQAAAIRNGTHPLAFSTVAKGV